MNKEEKASKKIHVLKKQVKKMRDNNDEINVHEMVLHNLHGSQQEQTIIKIIFRSIYFVSIYFLGFKLYRF